MLSMHCIFPLGKVQDIDDCKVSGLEEFCDRLAKLPLRFHPGDQYRYSIICVAALVLLQAVEVFGNAAMAFSVVSASSPQSELFAVPDIQALRQRVVRRHITSCYLGTFEINLFGNIL